MDEHEAERHDQVQPLHVEARQEVEDDAVRGPDGR
jgi:hypothetical protein